MPRLLALVLLLVAGVLSLPLAAAFLDDQGTENWILPAQLAAMASLGALAGILTPGLVRSDSRGRRALLGALIGVGMAAVGLVVFWFALNGFNGA